MYHQLQTIRGEILASREILVKGKRELEDCNSSILKLLKKSKTNSKILRHYAESQVSLSVCIRTIEDEIKSLLHECSLLHARMVDLVISLPEKNTQEQLSVLSQFEFAKWN